MLDVAFQRRAIDVTSGNPQLVHGIDLAIRILRRIGEQRPHQLLLDAWAHGADLAEVDNADPPPGLYEEVARMGIRMKEAVPEHHLQYHPRPIHRHLRAIDAGRIHGAEVVHLDAVDPLEGQPPAGRLLPEHRWEIDGVVAREVLREPLRIATLLDVVGLGPQRVRELMHQSDDVVLLRHGPAPAGGRRPGAEDLQVQLELFALLSYLSLDDHAGES